MQSRPFGEEIKWGRVGEHGGLEWSSETRSNQSLYVNDLGKTSSLEIHTHTYTHQAEVAEATKDKVSLSR